MNREDRRALKKQIKKRGASDEKADAYVEFFSNADAIRAGGVGVVSPPNQIEEGDSVTLNVERIKARKNYEKMNSEYRKFVEENEDKIFTAHPEKENIISLYEDDNKWLFWSGDLDKTTTTFESIKTGLEEGTAYINGDTEVARTVTIEGEE